VIQINPCPVGTPTPCLLKVLQKSALQVIPSRQPEQTHGAAGSGNDIHWLNPVKIFKEEATTRLTTLQPVLGLQEKLRLLNVRNVQTLRHPMLHPEALWYLPSIA
jgi:hypothetical protein